RGGSFRWNRRRRWSVRVELPRARSCYQSVPAQLRGRVLGAVLIHTALQPLRQLGESRLERDLRLVAEDLAGLGDIREAVADITGTIVAGDDRGELLLAEHLAELPGHFQ